MPITGKKWDKTVLATPNLASDRAGCQFSSRVEHRWRLGSWAFLAAIFITGLPIGRELTGQLWTSAADRHSAAIQTATTIGLSNTWVAAAVWGVIYLSSLIVIVRFQQRSFLNALRKIWPLTVLLTLVPISIIWVDDPRPVIINIVHGFGITAVAFIASTAYFDRLNLLLRHLMKALGLNLMVHIVSVLLLPIAIDYDGRWTGLTTNANTLGLISAIALWVSGVAYLTRAVARIESLGFAGIAIVPLVGSGSITSILVVTIALSLAIVLSKIGHLAPQFTILGLFGIPLILLAADTALDFFMIHVAPILGKTPNLSGRVGLWESGWEIALRKPFFGWGFDNHASVIRELGLSTVHFHNGYIDLVVRGGLVALVLFLILVVMAIYRSVSQKVMPLILMLSFISFFILYNLSEVSTMQFRNISWLLFITFIFILIPRREGLIR